MIDSSGDGQAVVAVGNPDVADNVVTFVPGTGAELSTASGDVARVDRMVADANLLDPGSTAGIMWLGYDAPDNVALAADRRMQTTPKPTFSVSNGVWRSRRAARTKFSHDDGALVRQHGGRSLGG